MMGLFSGSRRPELARKIGSGKKSRKHWWKRYFRARPVTSRLALKGYRLSHYLRSAEIQWKTENCFHCISSDFLWVKVKVYLQSCSPVGKSLCSQGWCHFLSQLRAPGGPKIKWWWLWSCWLWWWWWSLPARRGRVMLVTWDCTAQVVGGQRALENPHFSQKVSAIQDDSHYHVNQQNSQPLICTTHLPPVLPLRFY